MAVGIFEFGFGQGGAGAGAPVHRFEASIDVAGQHHGPENADLGGLVALVQGEIRRFPVGPDAPAAEAALLALHLLEGVGVGLLAQRYRGELGPFAAAQPLQHLEFDW